MKIALILAAAMLVVGAGEVGAQWRVDKEGALVYEETERVLGDVSDQEEMDVSDAQISSGVGLLKLESREGKLVVLTQDLAGDEEVVGEQELLEIEERLARNDLRIGVGGEDELVFEKDDEKAMTELEVAVDLATNDLLIQTEGGEVRVGIYPDEVKKLVVRGGYLTEVEGTLKLVDNGGRAEYVAEGILKQKFLGLFGIEIKRRVKVAADSGKIVGVSEGIWGRILNKLSF